MSRRKGRGEDGCGLVVVVVAGTPSYLPSLAQKALCGDLPSSEMNLKFIMFQGRLSQADCVGFLLHLRTLTSSYTSSYRALCVNMAKRDLD